LSPVRDTPDRRWRGVAKPFVPSILREPPPSAGVPGRGLALDRAGKEDTRMVVSIIPHDGRGPQGKLADAELHFTEGPLEGLKLIGFTVWEGRAASKLNVTFPARQYSVNGERRSFSLLRSIAEPAALDRLRQVILDAYADHQRMAVAS
jgi:hypothetical protein